MGRLAIVLAIAACGSSARVDPDARTGDAIAIDAPVSEGEFGDACTRHTDCISGYCIEPEGGVGGQCTRTCDDDCPTGWDCLSVEFPMAEVRVCVPATGRLCAPCVDDSECPGGACLALDGEQRCGSACAGECPTGYTCAADAAGTHAGTYCQPVTASCTCSAELAGAQRSCKSTNATGTCWGTQTCSTTGWSACTATTPAPETCDGVDNDCNFVIDDGVGGGEACTNTNAAGSCPGVRTCDGANGFVCNGPTPMAETCNSLDDNCNGSVDEAYPDLGELCSAGVGACLRFGSMRCNAGGTGTECGAVAGMPSAESCNLADDDCDGKTDEAYPTLGTACTSGVGACARQGTFVCRADGTGVECSATPGAPTGSETCNYVDDDCNGVVDDGFRDPGSGVYNTDFHCGACGTDCTAAFGSAPNASGACSVSGTTATCGLRCDPGYANLNGATSDGCEFQLDTAAIYVSGNDTTAVDDSSCGLGPTGTGTGHYPCRTIQFGMQRAANTSRPRVLVADATYNASVVLANGISLLGGYRADTWERHLATTATIIQGSQVVSTVHEGAVFAIGITQPTVFEGFVVRGPFNTRSGGNSYAIYIATSTANLTIRNNQLFGGRGGPGTAGTPGANGQPGANGAAYSASAYDAFQTSGSGACGSNNNRGAYGGGARTCGTTNVSGGHGGGNNCTPSRSTQNSTSLAPALAGATGGGSHGASGAAGARGYDAAHQSSTCFVPVSGSNVLPMFGSDGSAGGSGQPGPGVNGCGAAAGSVASGHWVGGSGASGVAGFHGGGGGGGGAGGGADCQSCNVGNMTNDLLGGHGGGGGSGGCGGAGGGGGGAGGGAFVVFVTGGSAPTLANNTLTLGSGGDGGDGGIGGAGGLGGTGSQGGQTGNLFCSGKGGRGGDGGDGGAASGGGGGCGGSSFGIYTQGVGSPGYCASNTVSGGAAGAGGTGGYSAGNPGGNGVAGVVATCTSI